MQITPHNILFLQVSSVKKLFLNTAISHGMKLLQIVSLFENSSGSIDPKPDYQKEMQ